MQKNTCDRVIDKKFVVLAAFFVMSLLVSNIVASKVVNVLGFIVPAAVVVYPITFLCTDIIGELYGARWANYVVKLGVYVQIFGALLIYVAVKMPVAEFMSGYQNTFEKVLSQNLRFVVASLVAYIVSQFNDVIVFHKLKQKYSTQKWIRNNASTMTSQLIDTLIFITIAFYGVVPNLFHMVVSQYVVKFILALLDTPFFYFFTRETKKGKCNGKIHQMDIG